MPGGRPKPLEREKLDWETVRESLIAFFVPEKERGRLGGDVVTFTVAGILTARFEAVVHDPARHGWLEFEVTEAERDRWGVDTAALAKAAGWNSTSSSEWPAIAEGVRVYAYPEGDSDWISHLLAPSPLLEHSDRPDPGIMMVATPTKAFLAGSGDAGGERLLLEAATEACGGRPPLTKRPLVVNEGWTGWSLLPDDRNLLAAEYARRFGPVH